MTHPADIALLRYAGGEHSKDTTDHLASCAPCRSIVQDSRRVSAALRALSAPPAPPWFGHVAPIQRPRWHAIAAMFVAGILVGGTATHVGESDVSFAGLVPTAERTVLPTAAHPFGPGRWTYLRRDYVDSVLWANPHLETVTVDSTPTEWIVVSSDDDSLRVNRSDLAPLSEAWGAPRDRVHGATTFARDSTIFSAWTTTRTHRVAYPISDSGHARIADEKMLRLYFRTVALGRHWHSEVRLLAYRGWGASVTVSPMVIGRHGIDTPVGRCDCWQVTLSIRGHQMMIWVRAEDGVVVKTEDRYGVTELVAEDPLPS